MPAKPRPKRLRRKENRMPTKSGSHDENRSVADKRQAAEAKDPGQIPGKPQPPESKQYNTDTGEELTKDNPDKTGGDPGKRHPDSSVNPTPTGPRPRSLDAVGDSIESLVKERSAFTHNAIDEVLIEKIPGWDTVRDRVEAVDWVWRQCKANGMPMV